MRIPANRSTASKWLSLEQGEKLLKKSVKLARDERDVLWKTVETIGDHSYNRALVAASVGSYGAYLVDGSEY
ncbi:homocysteine S-methyltransferase 1, partial [Tanacetum coccineum]